MRPTEERSLPKPTPQQMAWQDMELVSFHHFGINTFTGKQHGTGEEDPRLFDPTGLDCRQWARAMKAGGVKLGILTAKHHDGFCLWPSKFTAHSVRNSPWKGRRGDVVREFVDAFRAEGLKVGLYLSPADWHQEHHAPPGYGTFFRNQLRELLTGYGELGEVWFDGYQAKEHDWASYYRLIRELQPQALIAICGPDIRWVGNEEGLARAGGLRPGQPDESSVQKSSSDFQNLSPDGRFAWHPAECDTSMHEGWFFGPESAAKVHSLDKLMDLYYKSVGRNAVLLLNVGPDRRGLLHENHVARLAEFHAEVRRRFGRPLAETAGRGMELVLDLGKSVRIDHVVVMEAIAQSERVQEFHVDARRGKAWEPLPEACGDAIGHKRIFQLGPVEASAVRLRVARAVGEPVIHSLAVYNAGEGRPAR